MGLMILMTRPLTKRTPVHSRLSADIVDVHLTPTFVAEDVVVAEVKVEAISQLLEVASALTSVVTTLILEIERSLMDLRSQIANHTRIARAFREVEKAVSNLLLILSGYMPFLYPF